MYCKNQQNDTKCRYIYIYIHIYTGPLDPIKTGLIIPFPWLIPCFPIRNPRVWPCFPASRPSKEQQEKSYEGEFHWCCSVQATTTTTRTTTATNKRQTENKTNHWHLHMGCRPIHILLSFVMELLDPHDSGKNLWNGFPMVVMGFWDRLSLEFVRLSWVFFMYYHDMIYDIPIWRVFLLTFFVPSIINSIMMALDIEFCLAFQQLRRFIQQLL